METSGMSAGFFIVWARVIQVRATLASLTHFSCLEYFAVVMGTTRNTEVWLIDLSGGDGPVFLLSGF